MKKFTFSDHTADIRMHVEASTFNELIEVALDGMNSILYEAPVAELKQCNILLINISAPDQTLLLIDLLSEILTNSQMNHALYTINKIKRYDGYHIDANLDCVKVDHFHEDIKAVTYHEAEVVTNKKGNMETTIVFDI